MHNSPLLDLKNEPGIERTCKNSLTFRIRASLHSNETRAAIANIPNSAQLGAPLPFPYIISGSVQ